MHDPPRSPIRVKQQEKTQLTSVAAVEGIVVHFVEFAPDHDPDPDVVVFNDVVVERTIAGFHDRQSSILVVMNVVVCFREHKRNQARPRQGARCGVPKTSATVVRVGTCSHGRRVACASTVMMDGNY